MASSSGNATPDLFTLDDSVFGPGYKNTASASLRSQVINPAQKTLVLITAGQSNWQNINPTLYTPSNASVIDNFNVYDGGSYSIAGPLLGTQYTGVAPQGPGNPAARVADLFVANGVFNRVIIAPIAIGGTTIDNWSNTSSSLYGRISVAVARLKSRGLSAATTGITWALFWGQGESDGGTSQATYTASLNAIIAKAQAAGFNGRVFVAQETWNAGVTNANVRAAQAAVVNNTTVFSGGDLDTLNATNRLADNIHFNDTGAGAAATLVYNAMHASGSPF
jgi:hypothetical protein